MRFDNRFSKRVIILYRKNSYRCRFPACFQKGKLIAYSFLFYTFLKLFLTFNNYLKCRNRISVLCVKHIFNRNGVNT